MTLLSCISNWGVYVVGDGKYSKIGFTSKSVQARVQSLQTGNPKELVLVGCWPCYREGEQSAHRFFRRYKAKGEWFLLDELRVCEILKEKYIDKCGWGYFNFTLEELYEGHFDKSHPLPDKSLEGFYAD